MRIFTSFIAVGILCAIASLIYDLTKLTPGHITTIFVVAGSVLAVFGFYDILIDKFGYGLCSPIMSFGNSLLNGAYEGFKESGVLGLFTGIYSTTAAGISGAIIIGFIITLLCNPQD